MQLARLYKGIGEQDILRGLYNKHFQQFSYTRDALDAELRVSNDDCMVVVKMDIACPMDNTVAFLLRRVIM